MGSSIKDVDDPISNGVGEGWTNVDNRGRGEGGEGGLGINRTSTNGKYLGPNRKIFCVSQNILRFGPKCFPFQMPTRESRYDPAIRDGGWVSLKRGRGGGFKKSVLLWWMTPIKPGACATHPLLARTRGAQPQHYLNKHVCSFWDNICLNWLLNSCVYMWKQVLIEKITKFKQILSWHFLEIVLFLFQYLISKWLAYLNA